MAQVSSGGRGSRRFATRACLTEREARAALVELRAAAGRRAAPASQTLGAYLRWWLDESARPTISANTYRGYDDVMGHLAPIAGIPLAELRAEDIEAVCNRMTSRKGQLEQPASPKTVRNAQVMLRRALGQAAERGHVERNVARLVPLRRVPRFRVEALTSARAHDVMAAVAGDRYEAAYALAFVAFRSSEILGLSWADVDLERGFLTIRHQLRGSGRTARLDPQTKTEASAATVALPDFILERLRTHRRLQLEERAAAGRPTKEGLVFVTPAGYAVNGSWLTKHFQALLERAGLPRMRLHDLRHGAATLLVDAGVHPRVIADLLRHAPGSRETMSRYAHVTASKQREAAEILQKAIVG